MKARTVLALTLGALVAGAAPLAGQSTPADSALAACSSAARAGQEDAARAAAARAEELFRRDLKARPDHPDPRVGLARVISECRAGFANMFSAGRLIGESTRLLEEALQLDARHWTARFTLAMNHYHTPAFLGKIDEAIRQFEILLEQQGERADRPNFAMTYVYLGDLYQRTGRGGEAVALWQRGARLFPGSEGLRRRLAEAGSTPGAASAAPGESAAPAAPAYALEGVRVRARRTGPEATVSAIPLDRMEVVTAPGGAADLLQGIRMQGGVTQATDGSDLFVRGGEPAEAPVWVDGGRLPYPGTFETLHGGLFGVLDPNIMREAVFSSGGFSARYGNALSGVLDVQTQGRPGAVRAQGGISLAGGSAGAWVPLSPALGAWATGRLTDASLLVRQQGLGDTFTESPRSAQATAGLVLEPARGLQAKAVVLAQSDGASRLVASHGYEGAFHSQGATRQAVLSARSISRGGRRVQGTVSAAERSTGLVFGALDRERTDRSLSSSAAVDLPLEGGGVVRGGVEAAWLSAREGGWLPQTGNLEPGAPASWTDSELGTSHLGAFAEAELSSLDGLSLVAGARVDRLPGETGWTADPRLSLAYRLPGWTVRLGTGIFHQGRWRGGYVVPDAGTPAGIPRRARHLVLGLEGGPDGSVRIEAYRKDYDRYVPAGQSGPRAVAGRALGLDARVRWTAGEDLSGWVAYSFLHGRQELEDGRTVPSRVDVTHGLTAVGKWSLGEAWSLGGTARYATGRPFTPVVGVRDDEGGVGAEQPIYGGLHDERLPAYSRLDVRVMRIGRVAGRSIVSYLELLNALDRRNVMGYTYGAAYRERHPVESFFSRRVAVFGVDVQLR